MGLWERILTTCFGQNRYQCKYYKSSSLTEHPAAFTIQSVLQNCACAAAVLMFRRYGYVELYIFVQIVKYISKLYRLMRTMTGFFVVNYFNDTVTMVICLVNTFLFAILNAIFQKDEYFSVISFCNIIRLPRSTCNGRCMKV